MKKLYSNKELVKALWSPAGLEVMKWPAGYVT